MNKQGRWTGRDGIGGELDMQERAEAAARDFDVYELAVRIAAYLTGPEVCPARWTAERVDGKQVANIVCSDGRRLYLNYGGGWAPAGRVYIGGSWPQYADGRTWTPSKEDRVSITVDAKRDARVIATEIGRRLLPGYSEAFRKAKAYVERDEANKAAARACADRIAAHFNVEARHHQNESNIWPGVLGLPYCLKVSPGHDGKTPMVDIHTEQTEEVAMKVLALLVKETS